LKLIFLPMFRNKFVYVGLAIIFFFIFGALFAPWLTPYDPYEISLSEQLSPPGVKHLFGQDENGADILCRLLHGARISLWISVLVVFFSGSLGIILGLFSGYYGGWFDAILMRLVDILLAFPGLLLAIALVAVLGPDINNVIIALTVLGWVGFARLVRGQVLSVKENDYIMAARTSGQSDLRVMLVHILPNVLSPVIVQSTFSVASVIIAESSLSFLGLGAPPGTPSWGAMLSDGKQVILDAPHVSIFPGLAIMLVVIAFNFLGDGLRDHFDPRVEKIR
jgi:peptide/nickel transport system permease protein